jgi:hypothetical protein
VSLFVTGVGRHEGRDNESGNNNAEMAFITLSEDLRRREKGILMNDCQINFLPPETKF